METVRYVLYAEDDEDDRELMEEGFRNFPGFQLQTFANGMELLSFLKATPSVDPCLIILDINMPFLTGVETLSVLKQEALFSNIPTILFSTAGSPTDRKVAEGLDTQIMLKPSNYHGVKTTIENLLQHCRVPVAAA